MLNRQVTSRVAIGLFSLCLWLFRVDSALGQFTFATDFENLDINLFNSHLTSSSGWNINGYGGFQEIGERAAIKLVNTTAARSGSKAIQVTYERNEDRGQSIVQIPNAGSDYVRTRQFMKFCGTFDFAAGLKIHRIYSFDDATDRTQWDIVLLAWAKPLPGKPDQDLTGVNDTYMISMNANGGAEGYDWGGIWVEGVSLERNRWYEITTEVKLNDAGQANAEARFYLDGHLMGEKTGFKIRATQNQKVNKVLFGGWYSNSSSGQNPSIDPASPTSLLIDDISVTTQTTTGSALQVSPIANQTIKEDGATVALPFSLTHSDGSPVGTVTVVAQSSNPALLPDANLVLAGNGANRTIKATPKPNQTGTATITLTATEGAMVGRTTLDVVVTPVADTPAITVASTTKNKPTKSGLVVTRNPADGGEVTHFKITSIQHGSLALADGRTAVRNGTFLTFAQANAGLRFKPSAGFLGTATFDLQASTANTDTGLGGSVAKGQILVTPR